MQTAERCRPLVFPQSVYFAQTSEKFWIHASDVCMGPTGHRGRTHKIRGGVFYFSSTIICFAPDASPDTCTISTFDLPTGLNGCILGLGQYLPTAHRASPTTHIPNIVGNNGGKRASCCFAPSILMIRVHIYESTKQFCATLPL